VEYPQLYSDALSEDVPLDTGPFISFRISSG
jgi:hypothetical protein